MNDSAASVVEAVDGNTKVLLELPVTPVASKVAAEASDSLDIDLGRWLINFFIVFHVLAIVTWNLPITSFQQSVAGVFRGYLTVTGCWQSWCMFSPNPVNTDTYLAATIHYQDGSLREYTFPRIALMGSISKYRFERWRKFIENTQADNSAVYWPYLARYAAIMNNPNPKSNPPVSVDLYRYQRYIAVNNSPDLPYIKAKMLTDQVFSMPSRGPLNLRN